MRNHAEQSPPRIALAGAAVVAAIGAREILLRRGLIVGEEPIRLLTIALLGTAATVTAWSLRAVTANHLAAGITAFASLFAAAELLLPAVSDGAAPPACPGAQTRGVEFLATTYQDGVSVRHGPGRTFDQRNRFQGACTVGFVGHCLGEPTTELFILDQAALQVFDARWLVLPHERGFVAAGVVKIQGQEDDLGDLEPNCPSPQEFAIDAPVLQLSSGVLTGEQPVTAISHNSPAVGFATYSSDDDGGPVLTRLAFDADPTDGFGFVWATNLQPTGVDLGDGPVLLVAVSCVASEVPGSATAAAVHIGSTSSDPGEFPPTLEDLPREVRSRLLRKACLLPGEDTPPIVSP